MKIPDKRCWAEVSPENLLHNYHVLRSSLPEGCRFLGVVKADAYGHGALETARLLEKAGADYLAVACLDEALELREGGVTMPVLILGHTDARYTALLIGNDITQAVTGLKEAEAFSAAAQSFGGTLRVYMAADTGMSRLGFLCTGADLDRGTAELARACKLPGLDAEGIFTHFAVSDEPGEENERYTREQFRLFTEAIGKVEASGFRFRLRHCANSGAVLHYLPEMALDMVRPGLLLYGYGDDAGRLGLRPCMRLNTRVLTVKTYAPGTTVSYGRRYTAARETRMGVLGIGYADGLPRLCSNHFSAAFPGGPAPQCGSICMDMCMVDLTDLPDVQPGDEAEIFGPGADLNVLSRAAQTIPYELLCSVSKRVPRVWKDFQ
jgi:alanine racemase